MPFLQEGLAEFLSSLEGDLYLTELALLMFLWYEPECNYYDIDSLKKNLETAEFHMGHAGRIVANVTATKELMMLEEGLEMFAHSITASIEMMNKEDDIKIDRYMPTDPENLPTENEILTQIKTYCDTALESSKTKSKYFMAAEIYDDQQRRAVYYLAIVDNSEGVLLYLDINTPELNTNILNVFMDNLSAKIKLEIMYETPKHLFCADYVDIFIGVYAQMFIEWGMGISKTFAILCYNTLAFSMGMIEDDDGEGDMEGMPPGYQPGMMGGEGMEMPEGEEFDDAMYDG